MTDLQEKAMRMALEFCEDIGDFRGPYPYVDQTSIVGDSREVLQALRQALAQHVDAVNMSQECVDETAKGGHEPVAWRDPQYKTLIEPHKAHPDWIPLYTAPPKAAEWVNATHIEIGNLWAQHKEVYGFAMALDDLLKEKNT